MPTRFPCGVYLKRVAKTHKAAKFDHCDLCIHIKYNKFNKQTCTLLLNDNSAWYCLAYSKGSVHNSTLNENEFHLTIQGKKIKFKTLFRKTNNFESNLADKLYDAINEFNLKNSSQYYLKDDFNKTLNTADFKDTNFFHTSISSLMFNFDQLHTLLTEININLDLIGITENRLKKDRTRTTNIDMKGFTSKHAPTEESCCGVTSLHKGPIKVYF